MSLPASVAASAATIQTIAIANPLDVLVTSINSNPYFIGLMMLLLNVGGRFLSLEISKEQEKFLSTPIVRRFLLFAVLFVATRNILIAAALTIVMILLIGYLCNENSDLCVWKSCSAKKPAVAEPQGYNGLTSEEVMILRRLQDKQQAGQKKTNEPVSITQEVPEAPSASSIYLTSIQQLSR